MKTVLALTDFSPAADNACMYAMHIAKALEASLKICIAVKSDSSAKHVQLKGTVQEKIEALVEKVRAESARTDSDSHHQEIDYIGGNGSVLEVAASMVNEFEVSLVVMGISGADGHELGVNTKQMMEQAKFPVVLVPAKAKFRNMHKIAFATEMKRGDISLLKALVPLVKHIETEIQVAHITNHKYDDAEHKRLTDGFMENAVAKTGYPHITYEHVKSINLEHGLTWILEHGNIGMLVTVHHQHSFIGGLFNVNHTENLAKRTHLPLMIFPAHIYHTL